MAMVWEACVVNAVGRVVWFSPKSVWHPAIVNLGIKRKSLSIAISLWSSLLIPGDSELQGKAL